MVDNQVSKLVTLIIGANTKTVRSLWTNIALKM